MALEKYIIRIIKATGLSRKEIWKMINYKKSELNGLISDKKALFIIAKELCVNIISNKNSRL